MIHYIYKLFRLDSIVHRLFFWLILMVLLTSMTYLVTYSIVERTQTIEVTKTNLQYDLMNQDLMLRSWTEDREQEVHLLASFPVTLEGDYEVMAARYSYYSEYYDQIDSIIYIDAEGFVRINTKTKEVIYEENAENVKEKQLYQMVKNGDQQFYHIVDRTLTGDNFAIFFATPVLTNNGEFKGIVATVVYPDKITDLLQKTIRGKTGKLTLITSDGIRIVEITQESKRVYPLKNKTYKIDGQLLHHLRKEENGFIKYSNGKGDKIYSSFISIDDGQFYMLNEIAKSEVLQKHNRMVALMFGITYFIIVLGFISFIPISKRLLQPFQYLLDGINRMKEGDYSIRLNSKKFKTSPKEVRHMIVVFNEMVSSIQKNKDLLKRLSHTDGLTGIANRRLFEERFAENWEMCKTKEQPLSLLFIDIDHFKKYNDYFGHLEGDNCLKKIAKATHELIEDYNNLVARYGGEEFVIILPNMNSNEAYEIAKQVKETIKNMQIKHASTTDEQYVTVSIGVGTLIPTQENEKEDLIQLADQAVYEAKSQGRNRIIVNSGLS